MLKSEDRASAPPPGEEKKTTPQQSDEAWKEFPADSSYSWKDFLAICEGRDEIPAPLLRQCRGEIRGTWLVLQPFSQVVKRQLQRPEDLRLIEEIARAWTGKDLTIAFRPPRKKVSTEAELKEQALAHPTVKKFQSLYDARLVYCTPVSQEQKAALPAPSALQGDKS